MGRSNPASGEGVKSDEAITSVYRRARCGGLNESGLLSRLDFGHAAGV